MRRLDILFWFGLAIPAVAMASHTDVTVQQAHAMIVADPNLVIIDVREQAEYCSTGGHVSGALNYPYNSAYLQAHYTDFKPDERIMVICRSGKRSNAAAAFLDSKGFTAVYDILGGTNAWDDDYPTVGCIDTDKDQVNDDLDNFPTVFNPAQAETVRLADFSDLVRRWQSPQEKNLSLQDLADFCDHWMQALP